MVAGDILRNVASLEEPGSAKVCHCDRDTVVAVNFAVGKFSRYSRMK